MTPLVPITAWQPPTVNNDYDPKHIPAAKRNLPVTPFTGPHKKSLTTPYPGTTIQRRPVPPSKIPWSTPLHHYTPTEHTNPSHTGPNRPPYAQSELVQDVISSGELGGIKSFYATRFGGRETRPQNPMGRTGLSGRGTLGHWGANPAVDALLIRQSPADPRVPEIFLVWRRADKVLALPGGMQEGDELTNALKKEVMEEVGADIARLVPAKPKSVVYRGYVDDPRNTDNAWMETTAFCVFFSQEEAGRMPTRLNPTDTHEVDASKGGWFPLDPFLGKGGAADGKRPPLYASHAQILKRLKKLPSFRNWLRTTRVKTTYRVDIRKWGSLLQAIKKRRLTSEVPFLST